MNKSIQSGKVAKASKTVIRKKAAKPLTPDELATRRTAAIDSAKGNKVDLGKLRSASGSIEPIALFKAIWGLKPEHFPAIIHLLNNEEQIRLHTRYKLMQPVYVVLDGAGVYVNDYCLAYVIDADKEFLKCINAEGTLIATFPIQSTSVRTRKEYKALEPNLKPASEKPAPKVKLPLIGNSDFEPPTINDAVGAKRITKTKLRKSNLYDLFATFNTGSTLIERDEEEEPKKIKVKIKDKKSATDEASAETPKKLKLKLKLKLKTKSKDKLKLKLKKKKSKGTVANAETKTYSHLLGLDFTGYEAEPGQEAPLIVLKQRGEVDEDEAHADTEAQSDAPKVKRKLKGKMSKLAKFKANKVERVQTTATMAATPSTKSADKVKEAQEETVSLSESLSATRNLSKMIGKLRSRA